MSEKLAYLQQKKLNPADELRDILTRLESRLPRLKRLNSTEALILLRDLDQAQRMFGELEARGLNLTSERGQFESVEGHLRKQVGPVLKALGGRSALKTHRPQPLPDSTRWWWQMDDLVAEQRRQQRQRMTIVGGIIVLIFGVVFVAFQTIFAPDPLVLARFDLQESAAREMRLGEYEQALDILAQDEQNLVETDGALLLLRAMAYEKLGQLDQAETVYQQAEQGYPDAVTFHIGRAQSYLEFAEPVKAETDARAALELDDEAAIAWLLLGQSLEYQQRYLQASIAYETAGDLAFEQGQNQVVVMARLALGRLGLSGAPMQ